MAKNKLAAVLVLVMLVVLALVAAKFGGVQPCGLWDGPIG